MGLGNFNYVLDTHTRKISNIIWIIARLIVTLPSKYKRGKILEPKIGDK